MGDCAKIRLTRPVQIGIFMIVKQNYPKYIIGRKAQVFKMYKEMFDRWLAFDLDDADLKPELESIKDDDAAIQDRFAVALKFGTAGLRGVIGAGTNRMNIYTVRKASQGVANYLKTSGLPQKAAIAYDSRIKGDLFARETARVFAANGITVFLYPRL